MENDRLIVEAKTPTNYDGMPSISFTASEVEKLAIPFEKTIVGKFSYGIPKIF